MNDAVWGVEGLPRPPDALDWRLLEGGQEAGTVRLSFNLTYSFADPGREDAIEFVKALINQKHLRWIIPGRQYWIIELEGLKQLVPQLVSLAWLRGKAFVEPKFERRSVVAGLRHDRPRLSLAFYVVPEALRVPIMTTDPPIEIQTSLARFQADHPDPYRAAFILMKFSRTDAHRRIADAIKSALTPHGIDGLRADDKDYHEDLFYNVLTYLYGCGFGIAVFERIEEDDFNPNVSLEVGYLLALRKRICLLKDRTLKALQTDLIGKLYREFDPHDPLATIPAEISRWLADNEMLQ